MFFVRKVTEKYIGSANKKLELMSTWHYFYNECHLPRTGRALSCFPTAFFMHTYSLHKHRQPRERVILSRHAGVLINLIRSRPLKTKARKYSLHFKSDRCIKSR